ncbi:nucleotidyltransferase family protein [Shimia ponticola]|uniref:nucleotidyltransferase family protein n=1 Tax=Shimia ponticola TaxID=2582893 RepID=UPI002101EBA7|nr:nucleotidyltransferase family protein [Shimia ponticola]
MKLHILIPAAGASSRMRGRDKLTEDVDGRPLLRKQAQMAQSVSGNVTVALPDPAHPYYAARKASLDGLQVTSAQYPASREGLGGTVSAHVGTLPSDATHLMVLLPDLVGLTADDLRKTLAAVTDVPCRAAGQDGTPGHPVVFPASVFDDLAGCDSGDEGPRVVLRAHGYALVPLDNDHAVTDLDTPEDWAAWRAAQQS